MTGINVTPHDLATTHTLIKDGTISIKGKFTKWKNKHFIDEITITDFSESKKIELVNYCKKTDAIEIHYFKSAPNNSFKQISFPLKNCKLDCVRILVLAYDENETITECISENTTGMGQPDTSKGNIIVGNP
ncbi:hypothetical protein DIS18_00405 [Algibacter marinivivus]|uniref:Uncharacterized protein n=1 Tax=Algibacter marinivivus TaxID=2100723 RepID=A0A2U2X5K0_9FLAO|nr:hypothetical protein [Algibacter marinivivus]PWH83051.1 hypothetical protein DIS18_00405 [Algibacter marinivivus]